MFWAAIAGILLLSAFFSGSETAFMAVRLHRLRARAETSPRAAAVIRVAAVPERFLGAILTGNVFVNALAGVAITLAFATDAVTVEERAGAATLATLLTGAALLVFGEMLPKSIAARHPERWSLGTIRPVQGVLWLLGPVSRVLSWSVTNLLRLLGISRPAREASLTAAEMRASLRGAPFGPDRVEKEVLVRLAEVTGRRLTEVMTPRRAIAALPVDTDAAGTLRHFRTHGHTRMPVIGAGLDDIRGLVDLREALPALESGADFRLADHLLPARFTPGAASLAQALVQMREQSCRMLIVVDEHGGVEGLVTPGAVLGAIRGPGTRGSRAAPDGSFRLEGALPVSEANAELARGGPGLRIPPGDDYDTVAGFVLEQLGRIPRPGEAAPIRGGRVRVTAMERHRITRVQIEPARSARSGRAGEAREGAGRTETPDAGPEAGR